MLSLFNSDAFYSCGLMLLECTFVLVAFLLLHGMKRYIGSSAFYAVFGIVLVFTHLVSAAGLSLLLDAVDMEAEISFSALMMPTLGALLIVYAVDGTLSAQRLIVAAMACFGMFTYLCSITTLQCEWSGYSVSQGFMADIVARLLKNTDRHMAVSTVAFALNLFMIPIVYQRILNMKCRTGFATMVSMMFGCFVSTISYILLFYHGEEHYLLTVYRQMIPQTLIAFWTGLLVSFYLSRINNEEQPVPRSAMDIVLAFFGGYGKSKLLEQNLKESEQRWQTIIQNAGDCILITTENGSIVDANKSLLDFLGYKHIDDVIGRKIKEVMQQFHEEKISEAPIQQGTLVHYKMKKGEEIHEFEVRKSCIFLDNTPALLMIGRDITERERLAREREELKLENAHRQRLEAIGRLAGGIAHDFNNHIHAINGHLDLIYMGEVTEESMRHLEKIDAIAQQAGKLTGQLLGYARKGRRQNKLLDLETLLRDSLELFIPDSRSGLSIKEDIKPGKITVEGDHTQLSQMIMNLLINARDAMEPLNEKERILTIRLGMADQLEIEPRRPIEVEDSGKPYCCIRVEDTGPGVPKDIQEKIFEPFFTTKPTGKGTGMGLSMAYGVSVEHSGWIQYDTSSSGSAAFTIFLPAVPHDKNPEEKGSAQN